jgi:hypothetical protein
MEEDAMKGGATLEQLDGRFVLRFERRYGRPPEAVWRALVEPAELTRWFLAGIEGERTQGARLRFVFEQDEGPARVAPVYTDYVARLGLGDFPGFVQKGGASSRGPPSSRRAWRAGPWKGSAARVPNCSV